MPNLTFLSNRVKGNGLALSFDTGNPTTPHFGIRAGNAQGSGVMISLPSFYGAVVGSSGTGGAFTLGTAAGITTDASKSGVIVENETRANYCIRY